MFGVSISTRIPRSDDYTELSPDSSVTTTIAGITMRIENNRKKPVYLKWKV